MAQVTVNFSVDSITVNQANPTVQTVLSDSYCKSQLGYGDNVEAKRNGITLSQFSKLNDGDVITISQKANSKAL